MTSTEPAGRPYGRPTGMKTLLAGIHLHLTALEENLDSVGSWLAEINEDLARIDAGFTEILLGPARTT